MQNGRKNAAIQKDKKLKPPEFRRLTGVRLETFQEMEEILREAEAKRRSRGGKPHRLKLEDRLLMALEYLREYRTYFHLEQSYGLSESACYRSCRWIEDTLIKSKASERVLNENVIGCLKRFRILSDKYRNRRKRFGLRLNLISGIYNRDNVDE